MLYCPCTHSSHGLIQEIILPPPPGPLAALGTAGWQRSLTPLQPHLDSVPKLAPPRQDEICSHSRLQLPGQVIIRIRAEAGTPTAQNTEQRSQFLTCCRPRRPNHSCGCLNCMGAWGTRESGLMTTSSRVLPAQGRAAGRQARRTLMLKLALRSFGLRTPRNV